MKLGSLFDGSGGFPLAGVLNGIEPVWASEIEPFPLLVTAARFPNMKQLGDVMKIDGSKVEPVDIITFGSPCQDLSVAGKQAGIHDGARSSLFFEAIRIIREMRYATSNNYPRFAVWENVPGAFSSNKGGDFRAVLQAFCEAGGADVSVPEPPKGGWTHAGTIVGKGFSLAWRLYDAQFWGVPQRRKRIYLIADFGSERAGEILFKREGVSGDSEPGGEAWEGTAGDAAGGAGGGYISFGWANSGKAGLSADATSPTIKAARCGEPGVAYSLQGNAVDRDAKMNGCGWCENVAHCLNTQDRHAVVFNESGKGYWMPGVGCLRAEGENRPSRPGHVIAYGISRSALKGGEGSNGGMPIEKDIAPTMVAQGTGAVVYDCRGYGGGDTAHSIVGDHESRVTDYTNVVTYSQHEFGKYVESDHALSLKAIDKKRCGPGEIVCLNYQGSKSTCVCTDDGTIYSLNAMHGHDVHVVCFGNGQANQAVGDVAGALNCMHDQQAIVTDGKPPRKYIVRRLTPTECGRLQGFPYWWVDGAEGSDSAIYKMWGNGIALPCAVDVLRRIAEEGREADGGAEGQD